MKYFQNIKNILRKHIFLVCSIIGFILGAVFDQILVGLCLGFTLGLTLDNKKK